MSTDDITPKQIEIEVRRTLKEHWKLFAVQGVVFVVLGLGAIALPQVASIAVSAFIGWLLFIVGVTRAVSLFRAPHSPGYWASMLLAIGAALLGLILALFPVQGAQTLTIALVAYFIVHGAASLFIAFSVRADTSRWVLLLVSGLIDFLLAALILSGLPQTGLWVLGLYVGISLVMTGIAFISAALHARHA